MGNQGNKESCFSSGHSPNHTQKYGNEQYRMPEECMPHEATWLQWPDKKLQPIWIQMTSQLAEGEKVRIIVYDQDQKYKVRKIFEGKAFEKNIQLFVHKIDDVWIRDNGPIFVRNSKKELLILNFGFNGWGRKAQYKNCNQIPLKIAEDINMKCIDLSELMVLEGGGIEIDGQGVLVSTESCLLNKNRNPNLSKEQANQIFEKFLGIKKTIWLKGRAGRDITDMHIDGFFKFFDPSTIITMNEKDLDYWEVPQEDIDMIHNKMKTLDNEQYKIIHLPLTKKDVKSSKGKNLGKGSYLNFYVGNKKILVPNYSDENDTVANQKIQKLYSHKQVVGIKVNDLFKEGGMIHCVTMQQPLP